MNLLLNPHFFRKRKLLLRTCKKTYFKSKNNGFSLVEVMIVVAIIGVLMAVAVPDFVRATRVMQLNHQTKEMVIALKLAQSEATRLRQTVVMCRSNTAQTACDTSAAAPGWAAGWIAFVDANNNKAIDTGGTEPIIVIRQPFPNSYRAMTNRTITPYIIAFDPAGEIATTPETIRFSYDKEPAPSSVVAGIVINGAGRIRALNQTQCKKEGLSCQSPP